MKISLSFDIEPDLHTLGYKGITEGLPKVIKILERNNIKGTFFVSALTLKKFSKFFKKLSSRGHEIALHGWEHERFDILPHEEKESRIKKSIRIYKTIFNKNPKGFRTPQHSADKELFDILKKRRFFYDSSSTPLNLLQVFFFPKRFWLWSKDFFRPLNKYIFKNGLREIPLSSVFIPFTSIVLRIFPLSLIKIYLKVLSRFNKEIIFYAHSWDFIPLPKSKIDRMFSHKRVLKNFDKFIKYAKRKKHIFFTHYELASKI